MDGGGGGGDDDGSGIPTISVKVWILRRHINGVDALGTAIEDSGRLSCEEAALISVDRKFMLAQPSDKKGGGFSVQMERVNENMVIHSDSGTHVDVYQMYEPPMRVMGTEGCTFKVPDSRWAMPLAAPINILVVGIAAVVLLGDGGEPVDGTPAFCAEMEKMTGLLDEAAACNPLAQTTNRVLQDQAARSERGDGFHEGAAVIDDQSASDERVADFDGNDGNDGADDPDGTHYVYEEDASANMDDIARMLHVDPALIGQMQDDVDDTYYIDGRDDDDGMPMGGAGGAGGAAGDVDDSHYDQGLTSEGELDERGVDDDVVQ